MRQRAQRRAQGAAADLQAGWRARFPPGAGRAPACRSGSARAGCRPLSSRASADPTFTDFADFTACLPASSAACRPCFGDFSGSHRPPRNPAHRLFLVRMLPSTLCAVKSIVDNLQSWRHDRARRPGQGTASTERRRSAVPGRFWSGSGAIVVGLPTRDCLAVAVTTPIGAGFHPDADLLVARCRQLDGRMAATASPSSAPPARAPNSPSPTAPRRWSG